MDSNLFSDIITATFSSKLFPVLSGLVSFLFGVRTTIIASHYKFMREQREKAIFAITSEIGNIISESRQHGTRNIDDISNVISSCMSFSGNANIFKRRGIRKRIEQYKETINWEDAKNKFSDHNLNFHPMLGYKNKGIAAIHLEKIKEIIEK